jgi:hypothetical protein
LRAGDTFLFSDRSEPHLWILISDIENHPDEVIRVHATTYEPHKDQSCILEAGDHRRIIHRSCIAYRNARLESLTTLIGLVDDGTIVLDEPVSAEILKRIRDGGNVTENLRVHHRQILIEQNIGFY